MERWEHDLDNWLTTEPEWRQGDDLGPDDWEDPDYDGWGPDTADLPVPEV